MKPIHIIGGGLAGSEAAWQAANAGVPVILHEMRGVRGTDAHKTDHLAELVCSNSFRSDDAQTNAVGLLHAEMRLANSLIMACGDAHQVPAGSALAVDRDGFAAAVTAKLEAHPLISIVREEITGLPPEDWDQAIIATGPLTAPDLAAAIARGLEAGEQRGGFSLPGDVVEDDYRVRMLRLRLGELGAGQLAIAGNLPVLVLHVRSRHRSASACRRRPSCRRCRSRR